MLMMEKTFFTLQEVADKLEISKRSATTLIKQKRLKAFKVAGEYRVRPQDFDEFVEQEIKRTQQGN